MKTVRKFLLAAGAVAAMSGFNVPVANAADYPVYEVPVVEPSGFYAGFFAGWGKGDSIISNIDPKVDGFLVGGLAGWELRRNGIVAGVEADIGYTNIEGVNVAASTTADVRWLGSARLRLGADISPMFTVYGTGVTERGDLYLVMEHCPGGSLADRLLNRGPLTEVQSLAVGAEVTTALKYAHREGVLHRGVKPENILMSRSGRPVLSDFGMARLANPQTMLVGVTGTIGFTAPEVLKGEQSTVASDVWSVGALLHVLVSGRSPYATTDRDTIRTMIVRAIAGGELTARQPFSLGRTEDCHGSLPQAQSF